ncbi:MipA/OmpV family protein [uncultured Paraglaciecola sp.]|uniref:MipA/OmpV family protein n=1 Tax=uncultured Paraglaciecola sp. TaxID=1765024 RepID=UPI0025F87ADF|nr:MipA/OmpV family protein [uncultured Paraglaciecola sp.]
MYSPIKKITAAVLLSIAILPSAFSADIARSLRNNTLENTDPENFFEIGLGAGAFVGSSLRDDDGEDAGLGLIIRGSYNWNGFFVDVLGEISDPFVLGYNAYNNENWSFDVTLSQSWGGLNKEDDEVRFIGVDERESNTMFGGRLTGYFGKNILQFAIKHDVSSKSKGTVASAVIGRNWQIRNWNFHGLAGLNYRDAKYNDYFFGVSDSEANNSDFSAYDGKASVSFNSSMGVTYPINENWIYRASVSLGSDLSENDSPLFAKNRDFYVGIGTSISYVF